MRHLQNSIEQLKKQLMLESTLVEENLRMALKALLDGNREIAQTVLESDLRVDEMEITLEEECLKILALHQPVAVDLRYIVGVLKLNNDLERIGDLSSNIARNTINLQDIAPRKVPDCIKNLSEIVPEMLGITMEALIKTEIEPAKRVLSMDDQVDELHARLIRDAETKIQQDPSMTRFWLLNIGISRSLERIADHCTNIAEDVIYMVEGDISRHQGAPSDDD